MRLQVDAAIEYALPEHKSRSLPFEVVGLLEDANDGTSYAVLFRDAEGDGEFIVTDLEGELLEDAGLAQEILDDFLQSAHENE